MKNVQISGKTWLQYYWQFSSLASFIVWNGRSPTQEPNVISWQSACACVARHPIEKIVNICFSILLLTDKDSNFLHKFYNVWYHLDIQKRLCDVIFLPLWWLKLQLNKYIWDLSPQYCFDVNIYTAALLGPVNIHNFHPQQYYLDWSIWIELCT